VVHCHRQPTARYMGRRVVGSPYPGPRSPRHIAYDAPSAARAAATQQPATPPTSPIGHVRPPQRPTDAHGARQGCCPPQRCHVSAARPWYLLSYRGLSTGGTLHALACVRLRARYARCRLRAPSPGTVAGTVASAPSPALRPAQPRVPKTSARYRAISAVVTRLRPPTRSTASRPRRTAPAHPPPRYDGRRARLQCQETAGRVLHCHRQPAPCDGARAAPARPVVHPL